MLWQDAAACGLYQAQPQGKRSSTARRLDTGWRHVIKQALRGQMEESVPV